MEEEEEEEGEEEHDVDGDGGTDMEEKGLHGGATSNDHMSHRCTDLPNIMFLHTTMCRMKRFGS